MTTLHPSSRKQLMLQLLNTRNRAQHPISKGFTLIELLVVIVILGVLGAVGYQAYLNQIGRANEAVASTAATSVAKACAANLVVPDGAFNASELVDGTRVRFNPAAPPCAVGATYSVEAGEVGTANLRTCTATIGPNGEVQPRGCTAGAPEPEPGE